MLDYFFTFFVHSSHFNLAEKVDKIFFHQHEYWWIIAEKKLLKHITNHKLGGVFFCNSTDFKIQKNFSKKK